MKSFLDRLLPHREIGWKEIGEEFTRYSLIKTRWFNIYLHRLWCPRWHEMAHDHPWDFLAIVLRGGYWERTAVGTFWRGPGSILFRRAEAQHNVATQDKVNWSLMITTQKRREWYFITMKNWFPARSGHVEAEED